MATFDALERLQKFDWLIQKLHSLRSSLQTEQGLQELQKLHALQLLQKSEFQFNASSVSESDEDKMELCKNEEEEEEEEDEENEELDEEEEEIMDEEYEKEEEQTLPLALTTSASLSFNPVSPIQSQPSDQRANHSSEQALAKPTRDNEPRNDFPPVRFPTGLFPPLPFDGMFPLLGEDPELKVSENFSKVCYKLVGFYRVPSLLLVKPYSDTSFNLSTDWLESGGIIYI